MFFTQFNLNCLLWNKRLVKVGLMNTSCLVLICPNHLLLFLYPCIKTDGWTGPLAHPSLSSGSWVDKGQIPQFGIRPLLALYSQMIWKDEELKGFILLLELLLRNTCETGDIHPYPQIHILEMENGLVFVLV